jgi:hypothetical protein
VELEMKNTVLATIVALGLTACAAFGDRISDDERLEIYRSHAGEPVKNFQYFGRLNGWTPLGDSALAVWSRPNEAYLLELSGRCPDLDFASAISVSNQAGRVYARFDKVQAIGASSIPIPCQIAEIRPLDEKGIKQAEKDRRDAGVMPEAE